MTAVYNYLISTGTIVDDTTDLLTDVQLEYKTALGANLNLAANTTQGSLITGEAVARTNVMKNNADMGSLINPNLSYGIYTDAICSLLGISRGENISTVGNNITLTGNANTPIPAGARVQTVNGDIFTIFAPVTIPVGLSIPAVIESSVFGPIPLPVGPLKILDGVIGWGAATVTSGSVVTLGSLALSDPQLKTSRNQRLATQGVGSSAAIKAAILAVPNVTSCMVVENNTGSPGVVNGVTFTLGNSFWVCVSGTPDPVALAQAMYNAHGGGVPWEFGSAGNGLPQNSPNGLPAIDPSTGLTYNVKNTTPILFDTYVNLVLRKSSNVATAVTTIQGAVITYASGKEDGEPGFVVGASVSAYEIAGTVARQIPGIYISSCMVACVPHGAAAPVYPSGFVSEYVMSPFNQATILPNNVTVSTL